MGLTLAPSYLEKGLERTEIEAVSGPKLQRAIHLLALHSCLRRTLLKALEVAGNPGLTFFVSFNEVANDLGVYRSTVQRNFRRLRELGILESVEYTDAKSGEQHLLHNVWVNEAHFRHVRTFRIRTEKLSSIPRCKSNRDWEGRNFREQRIFKRTQGRKQPQPTVSADSEPKQDREEFSEREGNSSRPVRSRSGEHSPQLGSIQARRVQQMRVKLRQTIAELSEGITGRAGPDHLWVDYEVGDPRYRAPMGEEEAFSAACKILGLSEEEGRRYLE